MKKILQSVIFVFLLVQYCMGQTSIPKNPQHKGEIACIAQLSGQNEVPVVATTGLGMAVVTFSDSFRLARIQITVHGLSAAITGAHIHSGKEGTNGSVVFNFNNSIVGNKINASFAISKAQLKTMLDGDYYVNVHTANHTGGEVRGQLKLDAPEAYVAVASGANEVPVNGSAGSALASILYYPRNNLIEMKMLAVDLSGPITGSHFHKAAVGVNGSVVQNLASFINNGIINAKFKAGDYIQDLRAGNLYLNLHTATFTGGEVRGQILPVNGIAFDGWMNGAQEVPVVNTTGVGLFVGHMLNSLDSMAVQVQTNNLSGAIASAHIHTAALGTNGGVAINYATSINGKKFGTGKNQVISTAHLYNLLNGRSYFNAHTATNSGGEIRGQVYITAHQPYTFDLCQAAEVTKPVNAGKAIGGGYFSYGRDLDIANMHVVATQLSGAITGAHIHNGLVGQNGSVVYNFGNQMSNNAAFITLDTLYTANLHTIISTGAGYVNVHTATNAGGEIRGQIQSYSTCESLTSVNEYLIVERQVSISPNPANEYLTVDFPVVHFGQNPSAQQFYHIVDMQGRVVMKNNEKTVDITQLKSGVYTLYFPEAKNSGKARFVKL